MTRCRATPFLPLPPAAQLHHVKVRWGLTQRGACHPRRNASAASGVVQGAAYKREISVACVHLGLPIWEIMLPGSHLFAA